MCRQERVVEREAGELVAEHQPGVVIEAKVLEAACVGPGKPMSDWLRRGGLAKPPMPLAGSAPASGKESFDGSAVGDQPALIDPKRPCFSPDGPERKYSVFVGPAAAPLPNAIAQSPSIAIGVPSARRSWPL